MTLSPYMLCPPCPACASFAGVPAKSYRVDRHGLTPDEKLLFCAVCGWVWIGCAPEIAAALEAEAAWHHRMDGVKGPWVTVLKRRARRPGNQLTILSRRVG